MAALYPNGYTGNPAGMGLLLTIEQTAQRETVRRVHPEFWRRVAAMMTEANRVGVPLGPGTGWRVQPLNPDGSCKQGFACPGNSYHEGFMPDGRSTPNGVHDVNAMAFDMVPSTSWDWMGANCARFGLVDFSDVNNEPWHIQPVEIPRSRNRATSPPPLATWNLAPGGLIVTPADDAAIREIVREQTLGQRRAQTVTAIGKFQALVNANPTNGIYKAALAQEQARLVEYDAWIPVPANVLKIVGFVDTVEATLARIEGKVGTVNLEAIKSELTSVVHQAVHEALANATIDADVSDEDAEKIAGAVVAEIAS